MLTGICAVECLACEQWFHQECSDLSKVNIKAINELPSVHWYCRKCLAFATKLLKNNGLISIIEKLDTLIQTNEQHQIRHLATDAKVEQSPTATCISSECILKVSKELTAIILTINKVAHRVVPKMRSSQGRSRKMASTYASTTAIGL